MRIDYFSNRKQPLNQESKLDTFTVEVTENISFQFQKDPEFDLQLSVLKNGEKVAGMFVTEEDLQTLVANKDDTTSLISYLHTMGESASKIAELVETDLKLNTNLGHF